MPKPVSLLALATIVLAGCATSPPAPGGLKAGKFVTMSCSENKAFQARLSEDGRTVRVRAHPGSAELEKQGDGSFSGEGYLLKLGSDGGTSLDHAGKSQGKGCRPAA
jgi:hypothetical protein